MHNIIEEHIPEQGQKDTLDTVKKGRPPKFNLSEIEQILKDFENNSYRKTAKIWNCSRGTIFNIIKKYATAPNIQVGLSNKENTAKSEIKEDLTIKTIFDRLIFEPSTHFQNLTLQDKTTRRHTQDFTAV